MTEREMLKDVAERLRSVADDTRHLTSGNVSHLGCNIRGKLLRKAEYIETFLNGERQFEMTWQVQAENDIYDVLNDWDYHRFVCLMKDGTIAEFSGICDETCEGSINQHLDCVDDKLLYDVDDIVMWIEVPNIKRG